MRCLSLVVLFALALLAAAGRPGVVILPVGDSFTAGDAASITSKAGGRYGPNLSYRRYLYHMLTARGFDVRFAGSKSDCNVEGLDYDSHHEGYAKGKIGDIKAAFSTNQGEISSSITQAAQSLKSGGADSVVLIRIVSAGGEDAAAGRSSKDISDNDMKQLVEQIESATNSVSVDAKYTIVIPTPPPGGKRVQNDGRFELERDFTSDSRYEDFRFFLTWRGHFFEHSKNAVDCMSYFDFLRHYNKAGTAHNAFGDMAFARCIYDNLVVRKLLPQQKATESDSLATCSDATAKFLARKPTSKAMATTEGTHFEPTFVNRKLPPLTNIVAPAVAFREFTAHDSCSEGPKAKSASSDRLKADDAPDTDVKNTASKKKVSESCATTPMFPEYEPYASTTKDLWKNDQE